MVLLNYSFNPNQLNKVLLYSAIGDDDLLDPSALHQSFLKLAKENFIIRSPKVVASAAKVPTLEIEENDKFTVPQLELASIAKLLNENATQLGEHRDSEIIWRVNHDRFDVEMR